MITWWKQPRRRDFQPLLPDNVLDIVTRAFVVTDVGGLIGYGPAKGRRFEKLFYDICDRNGVVLSEKAGSKSLGLQKAASGFGHEVDAATRSAEHTTHWELKHLTDEVPKNEMLVFNGKGLDFLYGSAAMFARIPNSRFLLSGSNVRDECRFYGSFWGIMIIEPGLLPLPLIYEAVARGASLCLRKSEEEAVMSLLLWACRPLQDVVKDLFEWSHGQKVGGRCGPESARNAKAVMDIQEQIGPEVLDYLDEEYPEWISDLANETWSEVGGW